MKYENMPCPVCGSHMHEGDDIVVCPDCGTPCHRECWRETGHCINEAKHAEGFSFTPPQREAVTDAASADTESTDDTSDDMIKCHICGSENPVTSRNCNHCGALLMQNVNGETVCPICKEKLAPGMVICPNCGASLLPASAKPFRAYNPFTGDNPDEKIGDNTAGELGAYVRVNQDKYLKKFHNIENKGKVNFNWGAFFFGPFWFLFRKMFLYGLVLLMVVACTSLIMAPSSQEALEIFNEYSPRISQYNKVISGDSGTASAGSQTTQSYATGRAHISYETELTTAAAEASAAESETTSPDKTTESTTAASEASDSITSDEAAQKSIELQTEMYTKMLSVMGKPMLIVLAINLVINIICGFYADSLYYKKIKKDLEAAKEEVPDSNVRTMLISRRGGVSVLNVICGVFVYDIFQNVAASVAEYIARLF